MDKITRVNVEGHQYEFVAGQAIKGVCSSQASDFVKIVSLPEGASLQDGMLLSVVFVNPNSAGFAGTVPAYSADGENFFYDQALTDPISLPPQECYTMTLVSSSLGSDEYEYSAYPGLYINGVLEPFCDSRGTPCGGQLWAAGDTVTVLYLDHKYIALQSVTDDVEVGNSLPVSSNAVAQYKTGTVEHDNTLPVTSDGVAKEVIPTGTFNVSTNNATFAGFVTSSSQDIRWTVPFPGIRAGAAITFNSCTLIVRLAEYGYAEDSNGFDAIKKKEPGTWGYSYTTTVSKILPHIGFVLITRKYSNLSGNQISFSKGGTSDTIKNNQPVAVSPNTMEFTVSYPPST